MRVTRYDFGRLSRATRTPQGGIRAPAYLTRSGVFVYRRADGTEIRELRPAEEVFRADSLATLKGATVTDLHPREMVRADNWREFSIGHVGDEVRQDGDFVASELVIQDRDAVARVDTGERAESSCGYTCRIDATPGEHNGERYDVIQRDIQYNHVALGPRNWGRAGPQVGLRIDGGEEYTAIQVREEPRTDSAEKETPMERVKIKLDGREYEYGSEAHIEKLDSMHRAEVERIDGERKQAVKQRDELQAKYDAQSKDLEEAKKAGAPEAIQSRVDARVQLEVSARRILGDDVKFDGKTDREIMIDTIRSVDEKFDAKDKSDEYVSAYFDASLKRGTRADGIEGARRALKTVRREDSPMVKSRAERDKYVSEAATQPLALSK